MNVLRPLENHLFLPRGVFQALSTKCRSPKYPPPGPQVRDFTRFLLEVIRIPSVIMRGFPCMRPLGAHLNDRWHWVHPRSSGHQCWCPGDAMCSCTVEASPKCFSLPLVQLSAAWQSQAGFEAGLREEHWTVLPFEGLSCVKTLNHWSQELLLIRADNALQKYLVLLIWELEIFTA